VADPAAVARRWAEVLDAPLEGLGVEVVRAGQVEGITEIRLSRPGLSGPVELSAGTVRLVARPA
jgi:hypothetical protein